MTKKNTFEKQVIGITGISGIELGDLQHILHRDVPLVFISNFDDIAYYHIEDEKFISAKKNDTSLKVSISYQDFLEKYKKPDFTPLPMAPEEPLFGISSDKESIDHIASKEKTHGKTFYTEEETKDNLGIQDLGIQDTNKEKCVDFPIFIQKTEENIWKDRYYSLLAVLNTFHED